MIRELTYSAHMKNTWWNAVLKHDDKFDGRFVYAVRSTGIYCRPGCPSRRPNRSQVVFFPGPEAALHAGFRPCRRCKPQDKLPERVRMVTDACRYIEENHAEPVSLASLSARLHVSPTQLHRTFKQTLGITPAQYANACRVRSIKKNLRAGSDVTSAIYEAGFGSSSRVYERTASDFGMTPGIYGKGGSGMRIAYTVTNCPLGSLLVAATGRGLCGVAIGSSSRELLAGLKGEYPEAEIVQDEKGLSKTVRTLLDHLRGSEPHIHFPLDIRATAFQRRVWDELRRIPYGKTRSYSEIAAAIGQPKAARAVARACASNPVALVIPCHRVVSSSGQMSGYRWGKDRKQKLLDNEASGKSDN